MKSSTREVITGLSGAAAAGFAVTAGMPIWLAAGFGVVLFVGSRLLLSAEANPHEIMYGNNVTHAQLLKMDAFLTKLIQTFRDGAERAEGGMVRNLSDLCAVLESLRQNFRDDPKDLQHVTFLQEDLELVETVLQSYYVLKAKPFRTSTMQTQLKNAEDAIATVTKALTSLLVELNVDNTSDLASHIRMVGLFHGDGASRFEDLDIISVKTDETTNSPLRSERETQ